MDHCQTPTQAFILAAGYGKRLWPLTQNTPKPLLQVGDLRLIEYHLHALAQAGVTHVVINVSYLSEQIIDFLGDGERYHLSIDYSIEPNGPIGPGPGIAQGLRYLKNEPFFVISSDIWTNLNYSEMKIPKRSLLHCAMVDEKKHPFPGDATLDESGQLTSDRPLRHSYAGLCIARPEMWSKDNKMQKKSFKMLLNSAISQEKASGHYHHGAWFNVGDAQTLEKLSTYLKEVGPA